MRLSSNTCSETETEIDIPFKKDIHIGVANHGEDLYWDWPRQLVVLKIKPCQAPHPCYFAGNGASQLIARKRNLSHVAHQS